MEWHFYFFSPGIFICSDPDGAIGFKYKSVSALTSLLCFCQIICVCVCVPARACMCVCVCVCVVA